MKSMKHILWIFLFIVPVSGAMTQGPIEGLADSSDVMGNWKGKLKNFEKPPIKTPARTVIKEKQELDYKSIDAQAPTKYKLAATKAAIPPPKVVLPALYNNMVKVGYGRFGTPLGKLYLNTGRNDNLDAGLDFTHLSASNGQVDYAEFREDYGTGRVNYYVNDHAMGVKAYVNNTNYFYYADTILAEQPEAKDSLRQTFTKVDATAYLKRNYDPEVVNYDVKLRFRNFSDRYKNKDLHIGVTPDFGWKINENFGAGIAGNFTFSNSSFDSVSTSRVFVDFTPVASYELENLKLTAGLKVNSYSDSNSVFGAFPILRAEYQVIPKKLQLFAGLKGEMKYNTYYDMVETNRYVTRSPDIRPTKEMLNIYAGGSAGLHKDFNLSAKFYYKKVENQLIYFAPENGTFFNTVYDSAFGETGADIALIYNRDDKIRAGIEGQFRSFKTSNIAYNFNMPATRVDFWASYNFAKKVLVTTEVYFFGGRTMSMDSAGAAITQNAMADINLYADYRFSERISVFLELNNILGNKYYRWHNYLERPLDVKAGLTLAF